MSAMTKKPTVGGTVRISDKNYTLVAGPTRDGEWFYIRVRAPDGVSHEARSEGWRHGCGPWKIIEGIE
jgi:hypothetical protein